MHLPVYLLLRIYLNTGLYINSQFGYCPLVWMMHSQSIENAISHIHELVLSIVYKDKFSTFENLVEKDKAIKIHVRNLQVLVTETFKVKNGIAPKIISYIFKLFSLTYSLRNKRDFVSNHAKTVYLGTESLLYLGPKLWDFLTQDLKTLTSLTQFNFQAKKWVPQNCPCRVCKGYIQIVASYNLQLLHLYAIYLFFIYLFIYLFIYVFFNQLICNYFFIHFLIYILFS